MWKCECSFMGGLQNDNHVVHTAGCLLGGSLQSCPLGHTVHASPPCLFLPGRLLNRSGVSGCRPAALLPCCRSKASSDVEGLQPLQCATGYRAATEEELDGKVRNSGG